MNKINKLLEEKADNFHAGKLLTKALRRFKEIHRAWNYEPEEEV
jgi:hypothetical protein